MHLYRIFLVVKTNSHCIHNEEKNSQQLVKNQNICHRSKHENTTNNNGVNLFILNLYLKKKKTAAVSKQMRNPFYIASPSA